jgi:hypothetical protein
MGEVARRASVAVVVLAIAVAVGGCFPPADGPDVHARCRAGEPDDTLATVQVHQLGTVELEGALCGPDDVDVIRLEGAQLPMAVSSLVVDCRDPMLVEAGSSADGTEPVLSDPVPCDGTTINEGNNTFDGAGDYIAVIRLSRPGPGSDVLRYDVDASWVPPTP